MFPETLFELLSAIGSILLLFTLTNILQQILFKNTHEPPVVFHWIPFIGSTVTYGIGPFKFFFECQAKVRK